MPLKSANRSLVICPASASAPASAQQIVDQHLGVDLFLDVERRRVDDEVAPVLLVLAAPDELRVEVAVAARIATRLGVLFLLLQHRLKFGRRNVLPLGLVVRERLDGLFFRLAGFLGHADFLRVRLRT